MKKAITILILIMFSWVYINAQMSDSIVVLDMQAIGSETKMIDYNGKFIRTFSPEERPKIEDDIRIKFLTFSLEKSFDFFDFSQGYLPVVKNKNWKFYNIKGEEVKDFKDQFHSFTRPVDGIYRAYERINGSRSSFMVVFMNQDFEEMFGGQRFWEATNMKGGYAFVQLNDEKGPWAILDSATGSINHLDSLLSEKIRKIVKDSKGYGVISYKKGGKKDYLYKNGNIVNPEENIVELTEEQKKIKTNIQTCINNHSHVFSTGVGISQPDFMPKRKSENKELSFGVITNHKFIPNWLKLKQNEFFFCEVAGNKYFGGLVVDTLTRETEYRYYDYMEEKHTLTIEKRVEYIYGDRFFVTTPSPSGYGTNLLEILDPNGNIIYILSPKERLFVGIESTQEFKADEIYKLALSKDEDLTLLKSYTSLRSIEFDKFTFAQLPEVISTFKHLESLKISNCDKLTELPMWIGNSKSLVKIEINDCSGLKNLGNIIRESENLDLVKTKNYRFEKGFLKEMKETKPTLKIEPIYLRSIEFR